MMLLSLFQTKRPGRYAALYVLLVLLVSACNAGGNTTSSQSSACTALAHPSASRGSGSAVLANVPMPGKPFKAVATSDGQWMFVSFDENPPTPGGIAVLHKQGSQICQERVISLSGTPLGMTLSHDNRILVIADYSNVAFVDVAQAERGTKGALLGYVPEHPSSSTIEVALSPNEQNVFAANENDGTVSVIDFQRIRTHDVSAHALLGKIPLGIAPVGMAISPDNRYLYITSEADKSLSSSAHAEKTCNGFPQGSLSVAVIARVKQDPAHAIITRVAAGCSPVRVVLSPSGTLAWVTARGNNTVLAFDTTRLITNQKNALLTSVAVGTAPVGMTLIDHGAVLVVANSNRFLEPYTPQHLTVLGTRQALDHKAAVLASIDVGAFPRELTLEANGQMLLLTNYNSQTLSVIDVTRLPDPPVQN